MNNAPHPDSSPSETTSLKTYDWSQGFVVSLLRKAFVFFQGKLTWYPPLADSFFAFCLTKPLFKIGLLLLLLVATNPLTRNSPYGTLILIPLFSLLFFILCVNFFDKYISGSYSKTFLYLLLFFFLAKLLYVLTISPLVAFPDEKSVYDEEPWLRAQEILTGQDLGFKKKATLPNTAYTHMVAWTYVLLGRHVFVVKLFNLFLHLTTGVLLFRLGKDLFTERIGFFASFLFFISPAFTIFSLTALRESFFLISAVLAFFFLYKLLKKFSVVSLLFLLSSLVLVYNIRSYIGAALNIVVVITVLWYGTCKLAKKPRFLWIGFIVLSAIVLITFSFPTEIKSLVDLLHLPLEEIQDPSVFIKRISYNRHLLAGDNFAFYANADVSTPLKALLFLPIGISFGLFAPFPVHAIIAKSTAFFLTDSLLRYAVFFFACFGFFFSFQERKVRILPLLSFMIITLVFLALLEANIWTFLRHFMSVQVFIFLFAACGVDRVFPVGCFEKK